MTAVDLFQGPIEDLVRNDSAEDYTTPWLRSALGVGNNEPGYGWSTFPRNKTRRRPWTPLTSITSRTIFGPPRCPAEQAGKHHHQPAGPGRNTAAESRISDVDVATEMTNFVRNQILTQAAVAMLSGQHSAADGAAAHAG